MFDASDALDSTLVGSPGETILLLLMGYPSERDAMFIALVIAEYFGSNLSVFHLIDKSAKSERVFKNHVEWLQEKARDFKVNLEIVVRVTPNKKKPEKVILERVEEISPKLVIMMRRKKGWFQRLSGSICERVARQSPYSVLIVRSPIKDWVTYGSHIEPRHIVVPIGEGSPSEIAAIQIAIAIASASSSSDAQVTLLHVIVIPETVPIITGDDKMFIQEEKKFVKRVGEYSVLLLFPMNTRVIVGRDIGRSVRQYVNKEQADLVIMGVPYLPRRIIGLYGTDTSEILNNSNCPVVMLFQKDLSLHYIFPSKE